MTKYPLSNHIHWRNLENRNCVHIYNEMSIANPISNSKRKYSPWQAHSVQVSLVTFVPQQSNPSRLQFTVFVSSLQTPFPIKEFEYPLPVRLPRQAHCVQRSVLTQLPQQSSPSKRQSSLLFSSLQLPSLTNSPLGQSLIVEKKGEVWIQKEQAWKFSSIISFSQVSQLWSKITRQRIGQGWGTNPHPQVLSDQLIQILSKNW